jgi:hypothetical protein
MQEIVDHIKSEFNNKVSIRKKRPGVYQLLLPIFHEDGDMIDLFITPKENGQLILSDYGLTLQRLSYSYDIDTENKERIFQKILSENSLIEDQGNISLPTTPENLYSDVMHITQAFAKIGSMQYFKREVVESLFYEMLDEFIESELMEYNPEKNVSPLSNRPDLEVDYSFQPNGHKVFLFGVNNAIKAKNATITYQSFMLEKLNFHGWIVAEDFDKLPKKDRDHLTNAADKQFTTFEQFKIGAKQFLEKERNLS